MLGRTAPAVPTIGISGTTRHSMPQTNLYWRTIRPAEGFYSSEVQSPRRLPVRTFLPTGYEPNYPYPLLVFLHGHGGSEEQVMRLAPRVSRRNFIAIALRGPEPLGNRPNARPSFGWGPAGDGDAGPEDYAFHAIPR